MYAQSKRSAYPQPTKQQGTRSRNPARNGRKSKPILYRLRKICKRYNWARIGAALLIFGAAASTVWGVSHLLNRGSDTEAAAETRAAEAAVEPEGYIFKYGEGYAVDMEQLTAAWASEAGFEKRYELTDDERLEIAQVLTAEADGEPFAGKVAVAQCILQTCEDTDMRPHEVLSMYSYSKADEVRFIRGRLTFTDEDGNPTKDAKGRPCSAPFPSAVVIWRSKDMAQSLRDMVLDLIKDRDMTANEIAATLSDRGQQVSRSDVGPILTKAQAAGLIRNAGKRDCSVTGRSAIAWKAEKEVFHGNKPNHKGNPAGEL